MIVDDVTWCDEGAFQDGIIAQAVNQVTAAGVVYVSSAANGGSLTFGHIRRVGGRFPAERLDQPILGAGYRAQLRHREQPAELRSADRPCLGFISLKWSDPLGASTNDYDLFVLDSTGTTLKAFSAGVQSGHQDPYEVDLGRDGVRHRLGTRLLPRPERSRRRGALVRLAAGAAARHPPGAALDPHGRFDRRAQRRRQHRHDGGHLLEQRAHRNAAVRRRGQPESRPSAPTVRARSSSTPTAADHPGQPPVRHQRRGDVTEAGPHRG